MSPEPIKKELKLRFAQTAGMPSTFADQAAVQSLGDVILLTFYQAEPPGVGSEDLEKLDSITAYPTTRVAIRPDLAARLSELLKQLVKPVASGEGAQQ